MTKSIAPLTTERNMETRSIARWVWFRTRTSVGDDSPFMDWHPTRVGAFTKAEAQRRAGELVSDPVHMPFEMTGAQP